MMKQALTRVAAIETEWGGWKFRSRLEARWAIFMDRAGVAFEYEPEGFETEAGRYLPDFYLPELELWLEIKPRIELLNEYDIARLVAFGAENKILTLTGEPWPAKYQFWHVRDGQLRHDKNYLFWGVCCLCGRRQPMELLAADSSTKLFHGACNCCTRMDPKEIPPGWTTPEGCSANRDCMGHGLALWPRSFDVESCEVRLAFAAARRARFEHGETPK